MKGGTNIDHAITQLSYDAGFPLQNVQPFLAAISRIKPSIIRSATAQCTIL
jgi:hypothetical protein